MSQEKILDAFRRYVAIKLHFNDEAFFWKTGQLLSRIDFQSLNRRKDYHFFDRFSHLIKDETEQEQYLVSVFLQNPNCWIGEVFETDVKDFHRKRMIRVGSLTHTFTSEIDNILDYMLENKHTVRDLFLTNGTTPAIIKNRNQIIGGVTDETLAVIDKALNFTSQRNTNDPLWNSQAFRLYKYRSCLTVDKQILCRNIDKLVTI